MNNSTSKASFSNIVPDDWVLSRQPLKSGGFTIEHHMEKPGELTTSGVAQHALLVTMSEGSTHQFTRLGKQVYEGENPAGAFWLASANTSAEWAWKTVDETVAFVIEPSHLQQVAAETECLDPSSVALRNVAFGRDSQLEFLAQCCRQEFLRQEIGDRIYTDSLANIIALHLLRNYCTHKPLIRECAKGMGNKRLRNVLEYIDTHLDQEIGLADLAAVAKMSQHHLSPMFKQSTGLPPYRYVLQQRIQRAKQLLKQDSLSITDVALSSGFADQSHLTKHFRKSVGVTPKAYRENQNL
ncbi:Exoenzyme S synthesis regulatory protein ExsA [Acaryochloris thomasi RCC1774]|uniref:Exoenzyme S synthesis regulatory protein ExsA n=1 Tax=Acaryochloris thomasi RCC1774 TaxID=1764569 RepID=A0A2W1JIB2_9CYAN|nr:AraC family transcriptional regulator [Acaryochloris thomasi]PZD73253.1 Exoenzyme S synthesis regulatory protein ExsA [Acaryochloris thomasi RCC1774]